MFRCACPSGFGDIDDDAIGGAIFYFGIDVRGLAFAKAQRVVDVIADRCSGGRELLVNFFDAVYFKPDMVQSGIALPCGTPAV